MGISGISSTNSMSVMQMTSTSLKDQKTKNIENEITNVQQQMQKLSSTEDLSASEKADEKKKLQKEISSLNTKLEQHQEELLRSQKREIMLAELQEDQKPAREDESEDSGQTTAVSSDKADEKNPPADGSQTREPGTVVAKTNDGTVILREAAKQNAASGVEEEKKQTDEAKEEASVREESKTTDNDKDTDTTLSYQEMRAMVSADTSAQQANRMGAVVAKTSDGIAILKGEIRQDERRGVDTERKQAELKKMEKAEERATTFQFSILGDANNAMKSSTETDGAGVQVSTGNNAYAAALNASQEEQAQQRFYVSFG